MIADIVFAGVVFTLARFHVIKIEWYAPKWLTESTEEL